MSSHIDFVVTKVSKLFKLTTDNFISACITGNLDKAKYIYQNHQTLDISALSEFAFRRSCTNGHLELAKWLLTIKPTIDISANDESAFRESCEDGHLEVCKWLLSLNPDRYELTIIGDRIVNWNIKRIYPFQQLLEGKVIEECPICYDQQSDLLTNCGHMFCQSCINQYQNSTCPCCRHNNVTFTRFV